MIGMIMCETDNIYRIKTPSFLLNSYLCSLSAIYHQAASVVTCHKRCQPSSRQGSMPLVPSKHTSSINRTSFCYYTSIYIMQSIISPNNFRHYYCVFNWLFVKSFSNTYILIPHFFIKGYCWQIALSDFKKI